MIGVAVSLTVLFTVVLVVLLRGQQEREAQWALERRELLNRIQRPEMLPAQPAEQYVVPESEPDLSELVGTVEYLPEPDEVPVA